MSRALAFQYRSTARSSNLTSETASGPAAELLFGLERIDRKKLYGHLEVEALDAAGRPCELALLASDGHTLLGRGGSALALQDPDGNHVERQQLTPVGQGGEPVARVASSFDAPIALSARASVEDLLSHNVKAVYALTPPMGANELLDELRGGAIYTFPFSFRGGLDPDVGFLLASSEGAPFLLLGKPTQLLFVSLAESAELDLDEAPELEEDDEDVDFAMM